MRMYAAAFEGTVEIYVKSRSIENARELVAGPRRLHYLYPLPRTTFTKRGARPGLSTNRQETFRE